jgi:hypothetical protein
VPDLWTESGYVNMQIITTLYGQMLMLALIACGLAWMFSPDAGREIAKRCGVSILLFCLGNMLWPPPGVAFFEAAIRTLLALAAVPAAFIWLIHPRNTAQLLRLIGTLALGLFLLVFALHGIVRIVGL